MSSRSYPSPRSGEARAWLNIPRLRPRPGQRSRGHIQNKLPDVSDSHYENDKNKQKYIYKSIIDVINISIFLALGDALDDKRELRPNRLRTGFGWYV